MSYADIEPVLRMEPALRRYFSKAVTRADADDLAHDVFIRYARLTRRITPQTPERVIWRIAERVAKSALREGYRDARLLEQLTAEAVAIPPLPGAGESVLAAALDRLAAEEPELFEAFALTELRGLTDTEAGALMGVCQSTAHRRRHRACEALRRML